MELTAAVAILVAAIAPFITALFTHPTMQPWIKRLIAGTVAVVLGVMVAIATGKITGVPADWIAGLTWVIVTAAIIVSLAQGFYSAWKPAVEKFEKKTSLPTIPSDDPPAELAAVKPNVTMVITNNPRPDLDTAEGREQLADAIRKELARVKDTNHD